MKIMDETYEKDLKIQKIFYFQNENFNPLDFVLIEKKKKQELAKNKDDFVQFVVILTGTILVFMALFSFMMATIISDLIKKYVNQVKNKERKLQDLNDTLAIKVQRGIEQGKEKDKAILRQSKLARLGGMISMIAHQWRQPLTELSGVLMELETATRFKKVNDEHILNSIERSDKLIEFMSNTIDDFRNFYKPDKKKESFFIEKSCQRAYGIVNATLKNLGIEFIVDVKSQSEAYGYPTDYSQVVLNIIGNAKDILVERQVAKPKIYLTIDSQENKSIVTIKDNAGGISPEYFETLFDPYFSTKDSGTGLGLYISKHIIEKNMDGDLSVYNDDEGAVFKIVLEEKT